MAAATGGASAVLIAAVLIAAIGRDDIGSAIQKRLSDPLTEPLTIVNGAMHVPSIE